MIKIAKLIFLSLILFVSVEANVTMPKVFSDNMVLQRGAPIPVWGRAMAGEKVTVAFNKQKVAAVAGADGRWTLKLRPEKAGGPFTMRVEGENSITISNVLVGEVWLCSGQSNMEWTVGQSLNAERELAAADNPFIRQIKVAKNVSAMPLDDISEGSWMVSSPSTTKDFTGIGYFFARDLYKKLKVPIGIINSTWGGTNIETWISREGFESSDEFREMISKLPKLDLDVLTKRAVEMKTKQVEALQGFKPDAFDAGRFQDTALDESRLPSLRLPGIWETQSLGEFDGVVWFRRTVTLTNDQSKRSATLELAKIDDSDVTFVNDVEVGRTNQWDAHRKYAVPAGVLKEGKNLIVVKVTDTGGGGGIYGNADDLKLVLGDESVPLDGDWKFQVAGIMGRTNENSLPSLAYNAMIDPLVPYGMRGVLWYQGESNAGRSYQYRTSFPLLISDWRRKWNAGSFPFYFVQLATYASAGNSNTGSGWAELREAQSLTLSMPNTGMAVTTDIGNPTDVHPTNKQEVGRRLAAIAFNRTYGIRMIDSGPIYESMKIVGNRVVLMFDSIGAGLRTSDADGIVNGFEIAGSDQRFYEATGKIEGKTLVVTSEKVMSPAAVRFGWIGDASACNLFNAEGFPAAPFRTDDWKTVTKDAKYAISGF